MSCSKWLFQYRNDIFVETGTGGGGGIQNALKYGFNEIHSIEIQPKLYELCKKLFKNNQNVHLYLGDSLDILPKILSKIEKQTTFLLDAHVMKLSELQGKVICPVLKELEFIITHSKNKNIKHHSIIIDDVKFFNGKTESFGKIKLNDIQKSILDVDPTYVIKTYRRMIVAK